MVSESKKCQGCCTLNLDCVRFYKCESYVIRGSLSKWLLVTLRVDFIRTVFYYFTSFILASLTLQLPMIHSSNLDFRQIFHKRASYFKLQMKCVESTSVKAEMAPYHIRSELEVGSIVKPKNWFLLCRKKFTKVQSANLFLQKSTTTLPLPGWKKKREGKCLFSTEIRKKYLHKIKPIRSAVHIRA